MTFSSQKQHTDLESTSAQKDQESQEITSSQKDLKNREITSSQKDLKNDGRNNSVLTTRKMVMIALSTAILCIIGPLVIPLPMSPVPISLATLMIGILLYILGIRSTLTGVLLYLLLGVIGLPVFSGFSGGPGKLLGPTGGYLIGYLFMAAIAGIFIEKFRGRKMFHVLGLSLGTLVLYLLGTLWLCFQLSLSFPEGLAIGVIPYLPGDIAKIVLILMVGPVIARRIKKS